MTEDQIERIVERMMDALEQGICDDRHDGSGLQLARQGNRQLGESGDITARPDPNTKDKHRWPTHHASPMMTKARITATLEGNVESV